MPEKITVSEEIKVKKDGIINFDELYRSSKKFLEDYGLAKDEADLEKKYIERNKPNGTKQLEIFWHAKKSVSRFFSYHLTAGFLIIGMKDAEVQQGNIKRKLKQGSFEVKLEAWIETSKEWDNLTGLRRIYMKFIVPKRIEEYKSDLYDKLYQFRSFIKEFMGVRD